MSKRRITKQQSKRIADKQQSYLEKEIDQSLLLEGLVLSRFGAHAEIETAQGKKAHCAIRRSIASLVAGDRVKWQAENEEQGVVVSVYPRKNTLSRPVIGGKMKDIAANVTQAVIILAPKPQISWPMLDSYLIMTQCLDMKTVILLNKTDIPCEESQRILIEDYQSLGHTVLFAGDHLKEGEAALNQALNAEVSVFVGQSGVGKSSIIAKLLPHEQIATQAISDISELGKHTTSSSRYYHLSCGGALIDSPGVREFGLMDFDHASILQGYPEFKPHLKNCKFRDCNHIDSLGCALVKAAEEGHVSVRRYQNYLKLYQQYIGPVTN